ncbi:type II toxin-antitoxin system HicA family toxin [Candidatus Roizmanbacteria bacterium]|nr:type II toxin-antitoxin system HicA family toxin [Candidatus Roizmanbacteria bacterium]
MPAITPKKILKFLRRKGFYISRQSGSHMILHHEKDATKRVTIPIHNKDLKQGTLTSILKQAGIEKKEIFKRQ